jgi:hypothetical protein
VKESYTNFQVLTSLFPGFAEAFDPIGFHLYLRNIGQNFFRFLGRLPVIIEYFFQYSHFLDFSNIVCNYFKDLPLKLNHWPTNVKFL